MVNISQADVQEFLQKNKGRWFTTRGIAEALGINENSSSSNIRRLRMHGLIERRVNTNNSKIVEYSHKKQEAMIRKKPKPIKELKEEFKE